MPCIHFAGARWLVHLPNVTFKFMTSLTAANQYILVNVNQNTALNYFNVCRKFQRFNVAVLRPAQVGFVLVNLKNHLCFQSTASKS